MVSAVAASVTISGAWVDANSAPTRAAAAWSSAPTTIRSGCRASWTAVPSRRNSGFDTTATSGRSRSCSTRMRRAHRHRGLVHDDGAVLEVRRDLDGHGLEEAHVGRAVGALGGGHAQEDELRAAHRLGRRRARSAAAPSRGPPMQHVAEALLHDGGLAPRQLLHLGRVRLAAAHLVPEMGEDDRRGEADVAGADHRRR